MHFLLLLTPFVMIATSEIMDFCNHEFFLFKDKKNVLTYGLMTYDLFHVTNLSFYIESSQWEITYEL